MKKAISFLFLLLLYLGPTFSQDEFPFVVLNGEPLAYENEIYLNKGRTMIASSKLFQAFNLKKTMDEKNQMIYGLKDGLSVGLSFLHETGYIDDDMVLLDVAAEVKEDEVYVPLRFVAEALGADVSWHQEQRQVDIQWLPYEHWTVNDLLEAIDRDSRLETIDYGLQRKRYHEIIKQVNLLKSKYESKETQLIDRLIDLGNSKDFLLEGDSLRVLMVDFHHQLASLHSQSKIEDDWVMEDGYYHLNYELGYYYGYYENYQAEGYKFGYTPFDEGYVLSLVPYEKNKRNGIGYKVVFNSDNTFRYDMYYEMNNNLNQSLDFVRYESGIETFDRGDVLGDSVVRLEDNNALFIPPIDEKGKSHVYNEGLGYYLIGDGLEYVGFFKQWHLLGEGMYFGVDDGYLRDYNLLEQRSREIIEEIILPDMTDDEKIKSIHDYLAQHVRYDHEQPSKVLSHTAYGALILGEGVCDGYAGSFKYLLDLLEINNVLIFGSSNAIHHAWNLIEVDGVYHHYDLTWNDDDKGQMPSYNYYKKSSAYFKNTHQWDEKEYQQYFQIQ